MDSKRDKDSGGIEGYKRRLYETAKYSSAMEDLARRELWIELIDKAKHEYPQYPLLFFIRNLGISIPEVERLYNEGYKYPYTAEQLFKYAVKLGIIVE